jgi:hypothetical protein
VLVGTPRALATSATSSSTPSLMRNANVDIG